MDKMIPITITVRPLSVGKSNDTEKPLSVGTSNAKKPLSVGTPNDTKKPLNVASTPSGLLVNMNGSIGLYKRDPDARFCVDETETIVEIIKLAVNCSHVEAAAITDALAMSPQLFKVETISAQEVISFVFAHRRAISDTVNTPESMRFTGSKVMSETSVLGESGLLLLNNYHPQDYVDVGYAGLMTTF